MRLYFLPRKFFVRIAFIPMPAVVHLACLLQKFFLFSLVNFEAHHVNLVGPAIFCWRKVIINLLKVALQRNARRGVSETIQCEVNVAHGRVAALQTIVVVFKVRRIERRKVSSINPVPKRTAKEVDVSAQGFAHKYNLTLKSLADQTFLTAGDNLFGCSFGDWVDGGNHAPFNATDLENYKDCLQSDIKTVSNIYLALNRFAHPSARISLQGYLEQIFKDLPLAQVGGRNEIYLMRLEIKKGKEEEFLKEARKINDRRHWNESKANKQLAWEKIEAHFKAAAVKGFTLYGGKSFVGGEQAVSFISNHWCFFSYCFLSP